MAKISLLLFLFLFAFSCYSQILPINVWPKPTTISWPVAIATPLSPSFQIVSPYPQHPYLHSAIARYTDLLFSEHYNPIVSPIVNLSSSSPLLSLTLSISDLSSPLQHGVNKSYSLSISSSIGLANLTAVTVWGAMRGGISSTSKLEGAAAMAFQALRQSHFFCRRCSDILRMEGPRSRVQHLQGN